MAKFQFIFDFGPVDVNYLLDERRDIFLNPFGFKTSYDWFLPVDRTIKLYLVLQDCFFVGTVSQTSICCQRRVGESGSKFCSRRLITSFVCVAALAVWKDSKLFGTPGESNLTYVTETYLHVINLEEEGLDPSHTNECQNLLFEFSSGSCST